MTLRELLENELGIEIFEAANDDTRVEGVLNISLVSALDYEMFQKLDNDARDRDAIGIHGDLFMDHHTKSIIVGG